MNRRTEKRFDTIQSSVARLSTMNLVFSDMKAEPVSGKLSLDEVRNACTHFSEVGPQSPSFT